MFRQSFHMFLLGSAVLFGTGTADAADIDDAATFKYLEATSDIIVDGIASSPTSKKLTPAKTYKDAMTAQRAVIMARKFKGSSKRKPKLPKERSVYGIINLQLKAYSSISSEIDALSTDDVDKALVKEVQEISEEAGRLATELLKLLPKEENRESAYKQQVALFGKLKRDIAKFEADAVKTMGSIAKKMETKHKFAALLEKAKKDKELAHQLEAPIAVAEEEEEEEEE